MKKVYVLIVLAILVALLAACGGDGGEGTNGGAAAEPTVAEPVATEPAPAEAEPTEAAAEGTAGGGNAADGETLFAQSMVGENPGCATCHSLDGSQLVGPSLQGIASRAGTEVEGQTAEEYIRNSIVDPDAHVVEGFAEGVMPAYDDLSDQQVNDLVAFLMTQE